MRANGHRRKPQPRPLILTSRDRDLLIALAEFRYLSVSQIERLYFPSHQTATRRVRKLGEVGFLRTFQTPGMPSRFVSLTREGASMVAAGTGVPAEKIPEAKPKDYLFLKHFEAVTDFRIALRKECQRSGIELLGFIPEYVTARSGDGQLVKKIRDMVPFIEKSGGTVAHASDGVFALERDGVPALFFLEIDRGTEVIGNSERGVRRMIDFYLALLTHGEFGRYAQEFGCGREFKGFRALVVTTSETRLQNIRQASGNHAMGPNPAARFIWLSTTESIGKHGILGSSWQSLHSDDSSIYAINPKERAVHVA